MIKLRITPPVWERMRSAFIKLQRVSDAEFKDHRCPYFAFVVADASEWNDPHKRRAGEEPRAKGDQKALTPATIRDGDKDSRYFARSLADSALELDDELAQLANMIAAFLGRDRQFALAADYYDVASSLYGASTPLGREMRGRADAMRRVSRAVYDIDESD